MSKKNLKSVLRLYYTYSFCSGLCFFSGVLVPFFTEWGKISLAEAQLLQSWFTFWIFFLEVPTGVIADKFGRKHSMAMGSLINAIATIVYGSYPNPILFTLGELLFALGVALISGANEALAYDTLVTYDKKELSEKIFGKAKSFHFLGILLAAPLGSLLAQQLGYNAPMLATMIPQLAASAIAWSIPEPERKIPTEREVNFAHIARSGFVELWSNKNVKLVAINAALVAASAYFVIWLYQPIMIKLSLPVYLFGWVHAGLVLTEVIVSSNFGAIGKLLGSTKRFLQFSALVTSLSFLLTSLAQNQLTLVLLITLAGGFGLTRIELAIAYMNKFIKSENRATTLSFVSMFRRLALAFLNPFVGAVADRSLPTALFLISFLPLIAFLLPIPEEDNQ